MHKRPPTNTTGRGPNRSTRYPSNGTSQVSKRTKIVNATWISVLDHPNFSLIGLTNSVHPYCRLAIITMQMIPMNTCIQRYAGGRWMSGAAVSTCAISSPPYVAVGLRRDRSREERRPLDQKLVVVLEPRRAYWETLPASHRSPSLRPRVRG